MYGKDASSISAALRKGDAEEGARVLLVVGKGLDTEGNVSCFTKSVIEKAIQLYKENANAYSAVIFPAKGIPGKEFEKTEARVMLEYAISLGFDPAKAVLEEGSRDTARTVYETDKIIGKMGNVSSITVVAADYHMLRVEFLCEQFFHGRYGLDFVSANTHLTFGNESRLLHDDEMERLATAIRKYGRIRPGDGVAMAREVEITHAQFMKKK